jgi:hypothetical protein
MATFTSTTPLLTRVVARPQSRASHRYSEGRKTAARAPGFPAASGRNLRFFGGRTIEHLIYTNVYLGGGDAWARADIEQIDASLAAAMTDKGLNNVLAQYFADGRPTAEFRPSRLLAGPVPQRVYKQTVEDVVAAVDATGFDLAATAFCIVLPRGAVLVDGDENDGGPDSEHGLGGYHGSVHTRDGAVYYAAGVYSEGRNGIVAFDEPWKNVCATLYHELCEVRTDPDVEDAIRAGSDPAALSLLGWYSPDGGEIGDIPIEETGADLGLALKEVPLDAGGSAPVQLMWSNAVGGPEGPIARRHRRPATSASAARAGTRRR